MRLSFFKKTPFITLPSLVYLLFYFINFYESSLFDYFQFALIIGVLISIDVFVYNYQKKNNNSTQIAIKALYIFIIIFWFGLKFTHHIHIATKDYINDPSFKPRYWFVIFIFLVIVIESFLLKKKNGVYFQNVFGAILCSILFIDLILTLVKWKDKPQTGKKEVNFIKYDRTQKTTVLLITDEYHSPVELKKYSLQSTETFSNFLQSKGWTIKDDFKSLETSSIHSFASLINFNLSDKNIFSEIPTWDIGFKYLYNTPELIKKLQKEQIPIKNYGIFHLGSVPPVNRLYFYPTNFTELIFSNTILLHISKSIQERNINALSFEAQNKFVLDSLPSIVRRNKNANAFIYAHLMMPHTPYSFEGRVFKNDDILTRYIDYWHFTNNKLIELINKLSVDDNIRLIITGDHGMRDSKMIDPHSTFAAFWGFNEEDLKKVKTVQDLGSLINAYY